MRIRCAVAVAGLLALAGCGDDGDHANNDRPPSTINVTAAIAGREIHVSPRRFGGRASGVTGTTGAIRAAGTGTLQMDVPEGAYEIRAADRRIRPALLRVGAQRPSAQNELLLP